MLLKCEVGQGSAVASLYSLPNLLKDGKTAPKIYTVELLRYEVLIGRISGFLIINGSLTKYHYEPCN